MPQTFGEIIQKQDLLHPFEEQIKDALLYSNEHDTELDRFTEHIELDQDKESFTVDINILPVIDKTSAQYKNGLAEAEFPKLNAIKEVAVKIPVQEYGEGYEITRKALNRSVHNEQERITRNLRNLLNTYDDEKIGDAFLSSMNTISGTKDIASLEVLGAINDILFTNGATPVIGKDFVLLVNTQVATNLLTALADKLENSSGKDDVLDGEIGRIMGFRIVKSRIQALNPTSTTEAPFIAFGKTKDGRFPIAKVQYKENLRIVSKELGSVKEDDVTNKIGSIAFSLDGTGYAVIDDGCVVVGKTTKSAAAFDTGLEPFDYTQKGQVAESPTKIFPDVSTLTLKGTSATHTLVVKDEAGSDITSTCTFASKDEKIVTVDNDSTKGKITAVAVGLTFVTITKGSATTTILVEVKKAWN